MENTIPDKYINLNMFLVGNPRQFFIHDGNVFCVRKSCEGCPYNNNGCVYEDSVAQANLIPRPRRGIGFEEESFLILRLKVSSIKDVPVELWDNPRTDLSEECPDNLHFVFTKTYLRNPNSKLWVLKGQYRYYGSLEEFNSDPIREYFDIIQEYTPEHYVLSMDYSSIEPKMNAIVSQEPEWIRIFNGVLKEVGYEVEFSDHE